MKKAVLFDCDGVLVDSERIMEEALTGTFNAFGLPYTRGDVRRHFTGISYDEYVVRRDEAFRAATGENTPPEFQPTLNRIFAEKSAKLEAFPGIHDLVRSLKQAGIPFAVASNCGIEGLDRRMQESGLYPWFAPHIYSRQQVAKAKPAPDVYIFAAAKLGVDPADCIVIEDSPPGAQAGVAAGAYVIGLARPDEDFPPDTQGLYDAGADEVVADMEQMKARIFALTGKTPLPSAPRSEDGPRP